MMELNTIISCLKKIQNIYDSHDTFLEFCWRQHFFTGKQIFLKIILAKTATSGLLKINAFFKKGNDVIIFVHDVTNQLLDNSALGTNLVFYTSVAKELKLKVWKFWGLIPVFVEVTGIKLGGEPFSPSSIPRHPE